MVGVGSLSSDGWWWCLGLVGGTGIRKKGGPARRETGARGHAAASRAVPATSPPLNLAPHAVSPVPLLLLLQPPNVLRRQLALRQRDRHCCPTTPTRPARRVACALASAAPNVGVAPAAARALLFSSPTARRAVAVAAAARVLLLLSLVVVNFGVGEREVRDGWFAPLCDERAPDVSAPLRGAKKSARSTPNPRLIRTVCGRAATHAAAAAKPNSMSICVACALARGGPRRREGRARS